MDCTALSALVKVLWMVGRPVSPQMSIGSIVSDSYRIINWAVGSHISKT